MQENYTIGEIVKELKINKETIRYYEKIGLLDEPKKDDNGYRIYSSEDIEKIRLILIIKHFGFSLKEISIIFSKIYVDIVGKDIESIRNIVKAKINELTNKIEELNKTVILLEKVNNEVLVQNNAQCIDISSLLEK